MVDPFITKATRLNKFSTVSREEREKILFKKNAESEYKMR